MTFKSGLAVKLDGMVEDILRQVREGKSLEISYSGNNIVINPYRGVKKISLEKGELKGVRKRRGRVPPAVVRALRGVVERLVEAKEPFKIIVGRGDVEVRFNLDQYVKIERGAVKIVGFESKDEEPLSLFIDSLPGNVKIRFLKPLK